MACLVHMSGRGIPASRRWKAGCAQTFSWIGVHAVLGAERVQHDQESLTFGQPQRRLHYGNCWSSQSFWVFCCVTRRIRCMGLTPDCISHNAAATTTPWNRAILNLFQMGITRHFASLERVILSSCCFSLMFRIYNSSGSYISEFGGFKCSGFDF